MGCGTTRFVEMIGFRIVVPGIVRSVASVMISENGIARSARSAFMASRFHARAVEG